MTLPGDQEDGIVNFSPQFLRNQIPENILKKSFPFEMCLVCDSGWTFLSHFSLGRNSCAVFQLPKCRALLLVHDRALLTLDLMSPSAV